MKTDKRITKDVNQTTKHFLKNYINNIYIFLEIKKKYKYKCFQARNMDVHNNTTYNLDGVDDYRMMKDYLVDHDYRDNDSENLSKI